MKSNTTLYVQKRIVNTPLKAELYWNERDVQELEAMRAKAAKIKEMLKNW